MCQHIKSYVINFVLSQVFQMDLKKIKKTFEFLLKSLNSVRHNLRQLIISPSIHSKIHYMPENRTKEQQLGHVCCAASVSFSFNCVYYNHL